MWGEGLSMCWGLEVFKERVCRVWVSCLDLAV